MDLTGQRYGRLTVVEQAKTHVTPGGRNVYMWRCFCDCGKESIVSTSALRSGDTKSCGCLQRERAHEASFIDISGNRYGRLVAINPIRKNNGIYWVCKCDFGNTTEVLPQHLNRGLIRSCGCLRKDVSSKKNKKHGMSKTRIYKEWKGIKERCLNKNNHAYKNYGGRGITICDEWLGENGFEYFCNWAMQNGYDESKEKSEQSIDRIDVNGDYSPDNCRYADSHIQATNKRNSIHIAYNGEIHSPGEWDEIMGYSNGTVYRRIYKNGWNVEKAITTPIIMKYSHTVNYDN